MTDQEYIKKGAEERMHTLLALLQRELRELTHYPRSKPISLSQVEHFYVTASELREAAEKAQLQ